MRLFKRTLSEYVFRRLVLKQYSSNLLLDMQLEAKKETFEYIKAKMGKAPFFEKHRPLLEFAVREAREPGLFLEFGVARGKSMRWIARATDRTVHGFDSFEGLPEHWNGNRIGTFSRKGRPPRVPDNVTFHIGLFDDTLGPFLASHPQDVAFLHVDCDLYSSTKTVFGALGPRLRPGAIVLFDEYYNFPNWREDEFRAFQEFITDSGAEYEYIAYSVTGQQVAVRILSNPLHRESSASLTPSERASAGKEEGDPAPKSGAAPMLQ